MTAQESEDADTQRYKKALEAVSYYQQKEAEARAELASASQSTKQARERARIIFEENERRACDRRKQGQIEYVRDIY